MRMCDNCGKRTKGYYCAECWAAKVRAAQAGGPR